MRSKDERALLGEAEQVLGLVRQAAEEENRRWNSTAVTVAVKLIGDRRAGLTPLASPVVRTARRSIASVLTDATVNVTGEHTDSNVAMSPGVPAVILSGGGEGGNSHSRSAWYKPVNAYVGPQNALPTLLTQVGIKDVTEPS